MWTNEWPSGKDQEAHHQKHKHAHVDSYCIHNDQDLVKELNAAIINKHPSSIIHHLSSLPHKSHQLVHFPRQS